MVTEYLAHANPAEWGEGEQADCLRALAVAESRQAAAHARVLAAFAVPGGGVAGDGHRSPRVWLCWQTHATRKAAATKVSWMHRLAAHPAVAGALGGASVSVSWAQQIMDWTKPLPDEVRDQADEELLAAAAAGASLTDLAGIAEDIRREHARPDDDGDGDGFKDRGLRLARTFGGAGRLEADLSARCTTALETVLGSLSRPYGAEDTRTPGQRQHDALEEAMLRLIGADGLLPQQAGRPVRLELDITLQDLINGGTGSPAGPGAACDAMIQPVITGMADHDQATRHGNPHDLPGTAGAAAERPAATARRPAGRSTTTACPPGSTTPATRTGGTKSSRPPPVRRPKHPGSRSSPGRSRCCPARPAGPRGCAPGPPGRSPPPESACRWTSPQHSTPSPATCAAPSADATSTAGSPAATPPPPPATCTTSPPAKTADSTPSRI